MKKESKAYKVFIAILCCITDLDFWFPTYPEERKEIWNDYMLSGIEE